MNLSGYIARRYFFAKSSRNAVNIISGISILGVMVGTFALIIVLSAFNGLEDLVGSFYGKFNPDIKIEPASGKYFDIPAEKFGAIMQIDGVEAASQVLEERVLFSFQDKEHIGSLKGVDDNFTEVTAMAESIRDGEYTLEFTPNEPALILGAGVSYYLGYGRMSLHEPLQIFVPKIGSSAVDFNQAFSSKMAYPTGIFTIQPEFDVKYAITNIAFVRELLDREEALSAIELKLHSNADGDEVKDELKALMGFNFHVKDRLEQQAIFLKVMKSESLFTFLVFALILGIASFTIIGSLSMMMLDKKEHLRTLWAMGSELSTLRMVFFKEGLLICTSGLVLGLFLGLLAVLGQEYFGWIKLGQGYVVDAYPVVLKLKDFLIVTATVLILGGISSWLTSRRLNDGFLKNSK